MKARSGYLAAFLSLLVIEICIGVFFHDPFVRPYVGDMLVTALLCCLIRCIRPAGNPWLPVWVFGFSVAVECSQLLNLPRRLGLDGTVLAVLMGTSFDWKDLLCYGVGCVGFWLAERIFIPRRGLQSPEK